MFAPVCREIARVCVGLRQCPTESAGPMSLATGPGLLPIAVAEVVMGNFFVHTMMSLDGFIAGPNDDMSWVFRHAGHMPGAVVDEVIARTGAVLAGRRVYEVGECSDPRRAGCSTDAGGVRISSSP